MSKADTSGPRSVRVDALGSAELSNDLEAIPAELARAWENRPFNHLESVSKYEQEVWAGVFHADRTFVAKLERR